MKYLSILAILSLLSLSACATGPTRGGIGAGVGAGIGAIAGQAIGHNTEGTLIADQIGRASCRERV